MADNILKATIQVTAPGAAQAFQSASNGAKNLENAVKKVQPQISKLGDSIETLRAKLLARQEFLIRETDIAKIEIYNREIKSLEAEIARVGNIGSSSFGQVGAQAGKAFSVVRQLAFILPGIGIAGIFNVAFEGISKLATSLFSVGSAYNEAAVDAEVFKKANEKVGDDVARLQALVSVAKDVSQSTTARKNAIAELQRLYPDYLRNINLEDINSAAAGKAIDDLTHSIINKAIAQVYSTKVAEAQLKLDEKQENVNQLLIKQGGAIAQLNKLRNDPNTPTDALKKFGGIVQEITNHLGEAGQELNDQQEVVNKLTGKLKDATVAELEFVKTPKPEREKAIRDFHLMGGLLEILKRDAEAIKKSFQGAFDTTAKLRLSIDKNINADTLGTDFGDFQKKISASLQARISSKPIITPIEIDPDLVLNAKRMQDAVENINKIIQDTVVNGISAIGQTIGEAIISGDLQKGFQAFAKIIGDGFIAIGKQMVIAAPIIAALKNAIKSLNPAILLPAGLALIAIGSALNAAVGGLKGFAAGGRVQAGVPIIVGEQGREVFVPDTGGRIIPNHQLSSSGAGINSGGMMIQVVGTNVIRGNDLITILTATQRSQSRLT